MSSNVGRNDPCPCGSGLKYKRCHLDQDRQSASFGQVATEGAVVTHFPTGQTWTVGSPGMSLYGVVEIRGDQQHVAENPGDYVQYIDIEIPRYLPLADSTFEVPLDNTGERTCDVLVTRKRRGQQDWSTLDTTNLPYFTRLHISHETTLGEEEIVRRVLAYLEDMGNLLDWSFEPFSDVKASFVAFHTRRDDTSKPVLVKWFPLAGPVHIPDPSRFTEVTEDLQLLLNKLKAEAAAKAKLAKLDWLDLSFGGRVSWVLAEFRLYARQHAQAMAELNEEQIRDLCLILLKVVLSAEGEAFTLQGKSDIKIVNPQDNTDFILVEFKRWDGRRSFRKAFDQLARRYATGDERGLFLFFLSDRVNVDRVRDQLTTLLRTEPEAQEEGTEIVVRVRSNSIPITIWIVSIGVTPTTRVTAT